MSFLAICIIESWLLYKANQGSQNSLFLYEFYTEPEEKMIDYGFQLLQQTIAIYFRYKWYSSKQYRATFNSNIMQKETFRWND